MAVEEIKKVAQLEQEMKQRKEAAAAEGKQRVLEAQRLARRELEESRQQAEVQARQMMAKAEAEAAQWTLEALKGATQECEAFKEKARGRLDQAAAAPWSRRRWETKPGASASACWHMVRNSSSEWAA